MPYCGFCGKLCPTVPSINQHINITPKCKKASCEEFSQYVNDIWDNVPENLNDMEWYPLPNLPNKLELQIEDFHLEEDIQIVEETFNRELEETHLLPPPPPQPQSCHQQATVGDASEIEDMNDGHHYIEKFPEEYLAGTTWGNCKLLYECLDEEQKRDGGSHWGPFEDEDEWQLAKWLIQNIGQKQTDVFLKLPIVSFFLLFSWILS